MNNDERCKQAGYEFYHPDLNRMPSLSLSSRVATKKCCMVLTVLHRLTVFENRVRLKRIQSEEVTGGW
jgi:hypothetical protein